MMVEATRLLVTLTATAVGFILGSRVDENSAVVGATIGAGVGYVFGGAFGRLVSRALDVAPSAIVPRLSGPQLFAGAFGTGLGVLIGLAIGFPVVALMPPEVGWPLASLLLLLVASFSGKVFAARADELLASVGLSERKPFATHRIRPFDLDTKTTAAEAESRRAGRAGTELRAVEGSSRHAAIVRKS